MELLRRIVYRISFGCLIIAIAMLPFVYTLRSILGSPQYVRQAVITSSLYDYIVTTATTNTTKSIKNDPNLSFITEADVRKIIETSFSRQDFSTMTHTITDSYGAWATGHASRLNFSIDLSATRRNLEFAITEFATTYLRNLPACKTGTAHNLGTNYCLPPYSDAARIAADYTELIMARITLLNPPLITDEMLRTTHNVDLEKQFIDIPWVYRLSGQIAVGLLIALLALLCTVIRLSKKRRASTQKLMWYVIGVMFFFAITTTTYRVITANVPVPIGSDMPHITSQIIATLLHRTYQTLMVAIGSVIGIAIILLCALRLIRHKQSAKISKSRTGHSKHRRRPQ